MRTYNNRWNAQFGAYGFLGVALLYGAAAMIITHIPISGSNLTGDLANGYCGDAICDEYEDSYYCPEDCGVPVAPAAPPPTAPPPPSSDDTAEHTAAPDDDICSNGIDDDGDGPIDALDSDCDDGTDNNNDICSNGIDDDGDGPIDALDSDCDDGTDNV